MKAIVKKYAKPGLWLQDVPIPKVGASDILIRIKKTAICGTDLHIFNWDEWAQKTILPPVVIGHEFMGIVEKVGEKVTEFKKDDYVVGESHLTCGHCRNCRAGRLHLCRHTQGIGVQKNGAFAEYLSLPARNAIKIPADIDHDLAAIFDPYGNAVHSVLTFNLVGEDVLITGAGPIGIMAVAISKHVGARHVVITDINDYRLQLARQMGATCAINITKDSIKHQMKRLNIKEGFDVGLEMSGNEQAFSQMLTLMNHGAKVALLGILPTKTTIDWQQLVFKSITLKGIYGREMFETWYKMISMLQSNLDIASIITHKLPADDYQTGFKLMTKGQCAKVILEW